MSSQSEEQQNLQLFIRSLNHYSKRLIQLKDDEYIKHGNGKLREDLDSNSKEALDIAEEMKSYDSENIPTSHKTCVKCALSMYKKDLIHSKHILEHKTGIIMPLNNTVNEISHIESIFKLKQWEEPLVSQNTSSDISLLT